MTTNSQSQLVSVGPDIGPSNQPPTPTNNTLDAPNECLRKLYLLRRIKVRGRDMKYGFISLKYLYMRKENLLINESIIIAPNLTLT